MNSSAQDGFGLMQRRLVEATVSMFESHGIALGWVGTGERQPKLDERSVMAVIGYAGGSVRGALVLVAAAPVIQAWLRTVGEAEDQVDVCDTLGEFANRLLGRLKARLSADGFPILLSTPTTASGSGLHLPAPPRPSAVLRFEGPTGELTVRIDATFDDDFALKAEEAKAAGADAGDMLLF